MKVLLLKGYFHPEIMASTQFNDNLYTAIAKSGMEMVVYAAVPTRGISDEVREEYKKRKHDTMYEGKMSVHRFSLMKEGKNPLQRALRYTIQCMKEFNRGAFAKEARDCDVMFISSTPPILGATAALAKQFNHLPMVYNLQDIFPDSLAGTGLAKKGGLLWKIGRVIENFTYRNADKIIVISQDFKRNIMAKGVPEEKIEVVYNWVDEKVIVPVAKEENPLYEEFGISRDKFNVVYAGNLGNAQNIDILVNAARRLKSPSENVQFVIFGKGGLEDEIRAAKEREHIDNLTILPLQPYERVSQVYGLGDVCVVACKPGLGGAAMPSKTWSIMSSGRAVLANFDEGELKEILEGNGCGVFTKADDVDGFVNAIVKLSQTPERCAEMGLNGRRFILNNLTREVGTQKYVNVIKSIAKQ